MLETVSSRAPCQRLGAPPAIFSASGLAVLIVLAVLALLGFYGTRPPPMAPASAPATAFSAERALRYLPHIAHEAHPTGTAEAAKVRDYLVAELTALGLKPERQRGLAIGQARKAGDAGMVENIVALIPGSKPGKAVMLVAHYDSVPNSKGAADDGASVAAILETARALLAGERLQNDVVLLLTDAEEVGSLGAELFVSAHPMAQRIGVALNFEYRGNRGPFLMFETSQGNGKLIDGLANGASSVALGNSLMYEVYKRLPNGSDMTTLKRENIAGLNFAAVEGHTSYHTALDSPELISAASVQHEGELMLALARYFGNRPLTDMQAGDHVYFDLAGAGLVHYPIGWVLPLSVLTLAVFCLVCFRAVQTGSLRPTRIGLGALGFLLLAALLAGGVQLLWSGIQWLHPDYAAIAQGRPYNDAWYLSGFIVAVVAASIGLQRLALRWLREGELALAVLLCWTLLALASVAAPGMSFLFVWPLLPILLAHGYRNSAGGRAAPGWIRDGSLVLGAAPALLLLVPVGVSLAATLPFKWLFAVMILLVLLLGLLAPLRPWLARRAVIGALFTGAVCLFFAGSYFARFDQRQPRPDTVFYVMDVDRQLAFWLSSDRELDAWNQGFFPAAPVRATVDDLYGPGDEPHWRASAPVLDVPGPELIVRDDSIVAGERRLRLSVRSVRGAPRLLMYVEGTPVLRARLQGQVFSAAPRADWALSLHGMGSERVDIDLYLAPKSAFLVRLADRSYRLPAAAGMAARPAGVIAQPFVSTDSTQLTRVIQFGAH